MKGDTLQIAFTHPSGAHVEATGRVLEFDGGTRTGTVDPDGTVTYTDMGRKARLILEIDLPDAVRIFGPFSDAGEAAP